ncbi:S-adenosyl-L-methionine-dependent methyltransferase [Pyronema domesticum]|nr:S-adenosyl-L-methionine-dependent methyltransferase [Pyronema domesticum]
MPTDEKEQDRLDLHHETMRLCWGKTFYQAPIQDPQNILDIGTGTGIWAIETADKFLGAEIIGTDLIPIQPDWVPSNCRFQDSFDYIHSRNISNGVTDWNHLVSEMMRCVVPGVYVEISEHSMSVHRDYAVIKLENGLKRFIDNVQAALTKIGRPPADIPFLEDLLESADFEDVQA